MLLTEGRDSRRKSYPRIERESCQQCCLQMVKRYTSTDSNGIDSLNVYGDHKSRAGEFDEAFKMRLALVFFVEFDGFRF